jgi:methenyltetrahydromethanopterin cyclohydrolase
MDPEPIVEKVVEKVAEIVSPVEKVIEKITEAPVVPITVDKADIDSVNWGLVIGIVILVGTVAYIIYRKNQSAETVETLKPAEAKV